MKGRTAGGTRGRVARTRRTGHTPRALAGLVLLVLLAGAATAWVLWRNYGGEEPVEPRSSAALPIADAATLARGQYLARAGNCLGCHTRRGGKPGAGGRAIATPFGTVYASNITPDDDTGLGRWSAPEFRRALRHGRSRDGRLLTPAFPYPNFTRVTREDADALYAWLASLPAVPQRNQPHDLRFPYNLQVSLAVWRALFFRAEAFVPDPSRSAAWNRGSYLVNGLSHCVACHASRNFLGATAQGSESGGAIVSSQHWYAPSLTDTREAGVADWPLADVVSLLKTGTSPSGSAMGPMAEVVARSTQYLSDADLHAVAEYVRSLSTARAQSAAAAAPATSAPASAAARSPAFLEAMARGGGVFADHCAACHGKKGEGTPGVPALVGNRAVLLATSHNVIQAIRHGGFAPATAGNPRPFGMPPFRAVLSDDDIAAVATYVRNAWGNEASAVEPIDVWRVK